MDFLGIMKHRKYKKDQFVLEGICKTQHTKCSNCGFPLTPPPDTYKETLFGLERVYVRYDGKCLVCDKPYTIVG